MHRTLQGRRKGRYREPRRVAVEYTCRWHEHRLGIKWWHSSPCSLSFISCVGHLSAFPNNRFSFPRQVNFTRHFGDGSASLLIEDSLDTHHSIIAPADTVVPHASLWLLALLARRSACGKCLPAGLKRCSACGLWPPASLIRRSACG